MSKRTRSTITETKVEDEDNKPKRGRPSTQPKLALKVEKTPTMKQPVADYTGDIRYLTEHKDIAAACIEILNWITDQQAAGMIPIAFDIQCQFNAKTKKPGKTATIQLCHDLSICFVMHLSNIDELPEELLQLLENKKVQLVGNLVKNNLSKFENDFPEVSLENVLDQCLDLGEFANNILDTGRQYTLAALSDELCKKRMITDPSLRTSDWSSSSLNDEQIKYAATSVYMTQLVYGELKKLEEKKCAEKIEDNEETSVTKVPDDTQMVTRRSTRSTRSNTTIVSPPKTKIVSETITLPFIEYKGKIKYYTTMHEIASASEELLEWVNLQSDEVIPIAFDMEWPFSFQTGPGKSAVIQLCADVDICYIFHLSDLKKLPAVLVALLNHDKVVCHGVNIKNDFRKLERDFPEVKVQKMIDQCLDLGVWCNSVLDTSGRWSMERLVRQICQLQISKDGKVRRSKWDVMPLTEPQQVYAAIDVYIAQVMYYKLKDTETEKLKRIEMEKEEFAASL